MNKLNYIKVITWFQNRRAKLKRDVDDTKPAIKSETVCLSPSIKRKRRLSSSDVSIESVAKKAK